MQNINSFHLLILESQSPVTSLATSIFDHAHPYFFDQILIYVNLYQHAKNQATLLICSGDTFD